MSLVYEAMQSTVLFCFKYEQNLHHKRVFFKCHLDLDCIKLCVNWDDKKQQHRTNFGVFDIFIMNRYAAKLYLYVFQHLLP